MTPTKGGQDAERTRVVAYLRVSTSGQEREGLGLEGQRAEIEHYCGERGWEILGIYEDVVSGAAADEDELRLPRPGFERMLAEANGERGVRYVVVYESSRLYRGDLARVLVQRALKKAGLDVRSVTEPRYSIHRAEPSDEFFGAVVDAAATYERKVIAARMRRGRLVKASQGGYAGGGPPYGYRAVRGSKRLEVNEEEAKIVRRIFQLRRRGGLNPNEIARRLNGEGLRTRGGAKWSRVQVWRILSRPRFYEGKRYTYAGVEAKAQHPAILVPGRRGS